MTRRSRLAVPALAVALLIALAGCSLLRPPSPQGWERDEDLGRVQVFQVVSGALRPAATGAAARIWDMFTRVVTPEYAAEVMVEYRVGDAPDADTLAYVYQEADPNTWVLAANAAFADDDDLLLSTLIHEYAHILSLQPSQFREPSGQCPTLELTEGCARPDAPIYAFDVGFWDGYRDAPEPENDDADIAWEFYQAHEDDFVDDYAATNVVEDFAESFMTFVVEDEPSGQSAVARKLRFFSQYPDYVRIRERIRAEFGL